MSKTIRDRRNDRQNTPKGTRRAERKSTRAEMRNLLRRAETLSNPRDRTALDVALDRSRATG